MAGSTPRSPIIACRGYGIVKARGVSKNLISFETSSPFRPYFGTA
jgi:hypothetical protein